ncbi:MAG TPA: hypothetical protein DCY20_05760 [Firmicutes bacterium]|nr:hypothetical protein [Bacillota bacterium]
MGNASEFELKRLYDAAIAFKDLKPWMWMYASQVIVVKDKETGIEGFCSVMGMMGEHFSLSVYLGQEGYDSYRYLYDKTNLCYLDHVFLKGEVRRHCISVSFESLEGVTEVDIAQAKALGYDFNGANQWPRFRYHEPGLYSWYIEEDWQCQFLTEALRQVMIMARLHRRKSIDIPDISDDKYYLRYVEDNNWKTKIIEAAPYKDGKQVKSVSFENKFLAYKLKKLPRFAITLQAIQFYMPNPVILEEGMQPFYMLITAIVDSEEGQLFFLDIQEDRVINENGVLNALGNQLLQIGVRPNLIQAEDEELFALLKDFCKEIEVELELEDEVESAHEFAQYLYDEVGVKTESVLEEENDGDIKRLTHFTDQVYELLSEQGSLDELAIGARHYYKEVIETFVLAMYTLKNQLPTEWTPSEVKHVCLTVLPKQLSTEALKEAKVILNHFINILGEDDVLKGYKMVLLVINNCI